MCLLSKYFTAELYSTLTLPTHRLLLLYVCKYACVCMCVCRLEDSLGAILRNCPPRPPFLRQGLSLPWNSPSRLGWLAIKLQGTSCLHFPDSRFASRSHYAQCLFTVSFYCGNQLKSLLSSSAHLSPSICFLPLIPLLPYLPLPLPLFLHRVSLYSLGGLQNPSILASVAKCRDYTQFVPPCSTFSFSVRNRVL